MECLSLNGWRVCQQKVHHNPRHGKNGGLISTRRFFQQVMFWEPKGDHKVETPQPSRIIFFRPKKCQKFLGTNVKNNSHQLQYTYIFWGNGCVLFLWFQWNPFVHFTALNSLGDVYLSSTWRPGFPGSPSQLPFTISGMSNKHHAHTHWVHLKKNLLKRFTLRFENPPSLRKQHLFCKAFWRKGSLTCHQPQTSGTILRERSLKTTFFIF